MAIEFDSVTKTFPDGTVAVEQLKFGIGSDETMVLIGPSGCGKTTTLRLLAGLEHPTAGSIWLDQSDVTRVAPADRNVAMLFQSDALYPHMSVRDNLSFGLKVKTGIWNRAFSKRLGVGNGLGSDSQAESANSSPSRIEENVGTVASRLGIERLLDRKPHQLSGGERQRVALGRAMVREPAAFLLDEPLSRLDARLAGELRSELRQLFRDLGKPVLYVTHNQREAMTLADRMAVMDEGKIIQIGEPQEVYRRPANLFVANFVGDVALNVLPTEAWKNAMQTGAPPETATIGLRPEHLKMTKNESDTDRGFGLQATVEDVQWLGDHTLVHSVATNSGLMQSTRLTARCDAATEIRAGDQVTAVMEREGLMFFDSSGVRIETKPADN